MEPLDRSIFVYIEPKEGEKEFAQCSTCRMFLPEYNLCSILGTRFKVSPNGSCTEYTPGGPAEESELEHVSAAFAPSEVGYEERPVRCENCRFFSTGDYKCDLYHRLNTTYPTIFSLKERVHPKGCCNANAPR